MSVTMKTPVQGKQTTLQEKQRGEGVYASLFEKLLPPHVSPRDINDFSRTMPRSSSAGWRSVSPRQMQVFMDRIRQSGQQGGKLDKTLIDHRII